MCSGTSLSLIAMIFCILFSFLLSGITAKCCCSVELSFSVEFIEEYELVVSSCWIEDFGTSGSRVSH